MTSKRRSLINLLSLSYLSKSKTTLTVSSNIKADRAPFVRGREGARGARGARGGARGREGARGARGGALLCMQDDVSQPAYEGAHRR